MHSREVWWTPARSLYPPALLPEALLCWDTTPGDRATWLWPLASSLCHWSHPGLLLSPWKAAQQQEGWQPRLAAALVPRSPEARSASVELVPWPCPVPEPTVLGRACAVPSDQGSDQSGRQMGYTRRGGDPVPHPACSPASLTASAATAASPGPRVGGQVPLFEGTGVAAAPQGWGPPLLLSVSSFCLSAPRPLLFCTPPARAAQPTDERSWVYSPLHYSTRPASDGESDTVSPQAGWEDRPEFLPLPWRPRPFLQPLLPLTPQFWLFLLRLLPPCSRHRLLQVCQPDGSGKPCHPHLQPRGCTWRLRGRLGLHRGTALPHLPLCSLQ